MFKQIMFFIHKHTKYPCGHICLFCKYKSTCWKDFLYDQYGIAPPPDDFMNPPE